MERTRGTRTSAIAAPALVGVLALAISMLAGAGAARAAQRDRSATISSSTVTESVLHSFCSQSGSTTYCLDGAHPEAGLIQGSDGNFYGTTAVGGANYDGTVFKITPGGVLTTLHSFCSQTDITGACLDGSQPERGLVQGADGNFYGTTMLGGANDGPGFPSGAGTVFKITRAGALTTLYSFCSQTNCLDGGAPIDLVQGSDGNFYGTTPFGGANGDGTVFEITPAGVLTTLHSFYGFDGEIPLAGLIQGSDGNFYGTTIGGGANDSPNSPNGSGTVFKITPAGVLTTLYSFCSETDSTGHCLDGENPERGLIQGTDGNFYGTTIGGGANYDAGTAFRITPSGVLTTLYSFCTQNLTGDCLDGALPDGVIQGSDGNFYGTTADGGVNRSGTVFSITPGGALTTLYSFCGQTDSSGNCLDGSAPGAGVIQGSNGNFYGTTAVGGASGGESGGTVFELSVSTPAGYKLRITPKKLSFGALRIGKTKSRMVTIRNVGKSKKGFEAVTIESIVSHNGGFVVRSNGCTGVTLEPKGKGTPKADTECGVKVIFFPTAGKVTATLTIATNLESQPTIEIPMKGKGTQPKK
jgi:uncharacterized repeat protein (TIGR03803 family)